MARRRHLKITVEGKDYDVVVEDLSDDEDNTFYPPPNLTTQAQRPAAAPAAAAAAPVVAKPAAGASEKDKLAPLGGTIIEIAVSEGAKVAAGDKVAVMEAMKMNQVITAHRDGTVSKVHVAVGQAVDAGQPLIAID